MPLASLTPGESGNISSAIYTGKWFSFFQKMKQILNLLSISFTHPLSLEQILHPFPLRYCGIDGLPCEFQFLLGASWIIIKRFPVLGWLLFFMVCYDKSTTRKLRQHGRLQSGMLPLYWTSDRRNFLPLLDDKKTQEQPYLTNIMWQKMVWTGSISLRSCGKSLKHSHYCRQ